MPKRRYFIPRKDGEFFSFQRQMVTRARFIIKCASEGVGMMFFGYFRWANQRNPANNGSWTEGHRVVIA